MASFLLSECLENIFLNFIKHPSSDDGTESFITKDLYSCTLVSRHWCRISTPFLYAYPFHHFINQWDLDDSYFKLIRTLLSCVPQSEIRRIYTTYAQVPSANHIPFNKKVSYSNISSTFNYVSFIRGFIFYDFILDSQNVCDYKSIWLSSHIPERISSEKTIRIMIHLINFIFKHGCNLTMLEFPISIKLLGNVVNLPQLISSIPLQNKLQHIVIFLGNFDPDLTGYSNVFNLLSMKSVNLRTLELNRLSFYGMDENGLNLLLCSLKNIRELKLLHCYGIDNFAKSLTKLEVLEFTFDYNFPADFLNQLLQSPSNTLTKLVININNQGFKQIFQQTPLYLLHTLSHLGLPEVLPAELISIFKSCTKLVYLDVILDDDEVLKGLGRFIPKTLERIKFKLKMNKTSFKESLGCFLEKYIIIGGALKYLEFSNNHALGGISTKLYECFDGIQIAVNYY